MGNKPKLLYVEDDLALSFVTRDNLEIRGYRVDHAGDGISALEMMQNSEYDLCILDVMLPKMDGFTLAARIRAVNQGIPILFLTARSTGEDRITGLTLGGDDYITKPFSMEELVLKIEVFLKRKNIVPATDPLPLRLGEFTYDYKNQQLSYGEKPRFLTQKENELLAFLIENKGRILKREEILRKVWGNDDIYFSRSLDVFVSRLRKVLKPDPKIVIETIHNTGYRLKTG
ncbi:MAG: response regulator transcription factor [Bacteroidetes bacterium]|nr:response regulator transcription factor [Bacteroidota bacterium]